MRRRETIFTVASLASFRKELYIGNYQTFGAMMNTAIAMECL